MRTENYFILIMSQTAETYKSCPRCKSTNLIRQTGEDEPTSKYGRLKCGDCGKHIQWVKDPSTSITTAQRQTAIDNLLENFRPRLSSWDVEFLQSIYPRRYLTPKQRNVLNRIGTNVLGKKICIDEDIQASQGSYGKVLR